MSAFAYMKVLEHWGSGITRLYKNCEQAGLREPELIEKAGCFRVNVFRNTELVTNGSGENWDKKGTEKKNRKKEQKKRTEKRTEIIERTEKVWKLICENPNITQASIMEKLGISRKKVQLSLEKLIDDGKIERVGSDRSGSWKVNV